MQRLDALGAASRLDTENVQPIGQDFVASDATCP